MYWYILCVVIVSGAVVAYLQSLGSLALVDLSDCCCFRSLPRLGELVDQILFERQLAKPQWRALERRRGTLRGPALHAPWFPSPMLFTPTTGRAGSER
jgi:hypothetical protein